MPLGTDCLNDCLTVSYVPGYVRKERKKFLTRGHVKDNGPAWGIQSYTGLCNLSDMLRYVPYRTSTELDRSFLETNISYGSQRGEFRLI